MAFRGSPARVAEGVPPSPLSRVSLTTDSELESDSIYCEALTMKCPQGLTWCDEHIGDLHQRHLGDASGQLHVVLEQQDHGGAPGRPQLSFRFCADGELIDDALDLSLEAILAVLSGKSTR
jgi:hypothetical protein